jgi:hypothetical protein
MERKTLTQRTVKIKFDGQPHQVELSVYTQVLLDFATIAKASTNATDPNADVGITISAPERGSFVAVLQLVASQAGDVLGWGIDHCEELASIVTVIGGVYGLHRWLAGKRVEEQPEVAGDGNVVVKDSEGTTITVAENVFNLYISNPGVPAALTHTFGALDEDPAITGFGIADDSQQIFAAERAEFGPMSEAPDVVAETECTKVDSVANAHLHVVKLVLERSYTRKWEFVWAGNRISANIKDEKFFDKLEAHAYTFGAGDLLRVNLEVTKEWDDRLGAYVNRSYTIAEVLEFIPRPLDARIFEA